ncbi:hypothetical protein [Pyxidicoccus xibeiensis]|uniref:hypothetical protein n=1 Tax=Pyxidicoccus xibeiensis TaxID=2906759 RepID=UPI0020A771C0|nr:hypothetical protein [Pyxidicoccus xibeiensis]MCP3143585.1 hypothetical protein [Pyxidicoccus xibeiensis]
MRSAAVMLGTIVVALALGGAPRAEAAPQDTGVTLGLRVGLGLPLGRLQGGDGHYDVPMRKVVSAIIPTQLDLGTFLSSRIYVGASFQYAVGFPADDCVQGSSCLASAMRFGINMSYHLPVSDTLSPWLGLGVGYEVFAPDQSPYVVDLEPRKVNSAFNGLELVNVQGGIDFGLGGPAWLGPFVTLTVGEYSDVNEEALHSWLIGGVRLQLRH